MGNGLPYDNTAPPVPDNVLYAGQPVPPAYTPAAYQVRPTRRLSPMSFIDRKISQLIGLAADIVVAILLLRIVLVFFGADPTAFFASLIYGLSAPLVAPFQGLFPAVFINQGSLDLSAIVALIAYVLAARLLQAVAHIALHW